MTKIKAAYCCGSRKSKVLPSSLPPPHLVPPEVVDRHHAGQVQQHAQALEGGHGQLQGAGVLHRAGRVVPAEGAALAAGQALAGQLGGVFSAGTLLLAWRHSVIRQSRAGGGWKLRDESVVRSGALHPSQPRWEV